MRLNFSGSSADEIREGIRRIGRVVEEQVELYSALTGKEPAPAVERKEETVDPENVLPFRKAEGA
jgi:2-aminoadipate transaminase